MKLSNDYTSDTASEISFSWSNTSEKVSECSGSTLAEGSVSSKGPKIVKPGKNPAPQLKPDPAALRGRRKPLYSNKSSSSSARSTSTTRSDVSTRSVRPASNQKAVPGKSQPPALKKTPPKPPNQPPATNKPGVRRVSNSPVSNNKGASGIPRSPLSKVSPPNKNQTQKENATKSKTERPKPPVKQGTFVKETSSVNAPKIDSEPVKLRDKKASPSSSQRNSGGSERNSGSPPEAWSKALDGFNFIVDKSQENGYGQPYKQIQMQKNTKEAPSALKRNTSSSPAGRKPSNIARPVQGPPTPPRSNSKNNLTKTGSGSNLKKTSSGSSLAKTASGSSLHKTNSGSSLNKGNSATNLRKPDSKTDLKKSDSNASLKNNSRPSTPVGRKNSNSSITGRKADTTPKSVSEKKAATPTSDKKPPIGGKKPAASKIATIWKKEDGDSPPSNASKLPVAAGKPKQASKPSGLPTPTKSKPKPSPPKRSDSLAKPEAPKESMPKSSTYDKLTADLDASHVPSNDESPSDTEDAQDLDTAFHASPSITLTDDFAKPEPRAEKVVSSASSFSLKMSESKLGAESDMTCSVDSLDDISMHSLPVNSGTWKKKHVEGSLTLPNADETCRSVPSSLSTIVNQSCDDSDLNSSSTLWRKYPESNGLSGEPQIWVKRDSKKDKSKSKSKKESKSVAQSIKSTLFGKKPAFGKIFGSQKQSSKDKKNKEDLKTNDNCRNNLLANPKAGTLWQESRTSPSAIVPPFNYSPPTNTQPKQEAVVAPTTRSEPVANVTIADTSFDENKRSGTMTPSVKHATKTEMLLARRRQSYLNNSMKNEDDDETKRHCMVTTV